ARLGDDPGAIAESLFEAVYEVGAGGGVAGEGLAARLLAPAAAPPAPPATAPQALGAPLDEAELGYLNSASALIGPRPRALKRFYNAYRLARLGEAPRGAVALSLAALMAPDRGAGLALDAGGRGRATGGGGRPRRPQRRLRRSRPRRRGQGGGALGLRGGA